MSADRSRSALFPGVRFAHAVSLGANCEPAHQLRRLGRYTVRGVFDWLVTPLASLSGVLEDRGVRLGQDFISALEGTSVRCAAYDLLYHHEFPRDEQRAIQFSTELAERCRRKMAHKMASLAALATAPGPVLFIRFGPESDLPWDAHGADKRPVTAAELNAMACALAAAVPGIDFRMLVLALSTGAQVHDEEALDRRIALERRAPRDANGWRLADEDWDEIFGRVVFQAAAPADTTLGETLYESGESRPADPQPAKGSSLPEAALQVLADKGRDLWARGQAFQAAEIMTKAFDQGLRAPAFLDDCFSLLTGEARYTEVLARCATLAREGRQLSPLVTALRGHAKLALQRDRVGEISIAADRERQDSWLSVEQLLGELSRACRAGHAFSFVRVGDGEARFLIGADPVLRGALTAEEAETIAETVWVNWFGSRLAAQNASDVDDLVAAYRESVVTADIVGVADAARLGSDTGHYGYLAAQEAWMREACRSDGQRFTSALNHHELDRLSPHLGDLLAGLPFIGVVSAHPDLARRLAVHFAIPRHVAYDIPAEGRLPTAEDTRQSGSHFPDRYLQLIDALHVPFPGAVFLVAAGMLGKVYCDRIKRLGGVALDIGSLADAWMGFDTRPGQMRHARPLPAVARAGGSRAARSGDRTVACVSMHKTGSTALVAALRDAGIETALHTHAIGPKSRALLNSVQRSRTSMGEMVHGVPREVDWSDPDRAFAVVTCVRDPVGQALSTYFQHLSDRDPSYVDPAALDRGVVISWFDALMSPSFQDWWFVDNIRQTLGFEYLDHPFAYDRRCIRHESPRLRFLCLRQEDETSYKEESLGWLLGRERIPLRQWNVSTSKLRGSLYQDFISTFIAPDHWLDGMYETEVIRHFYTPTEIETFRSRWRD